MIRMSIAPPLHAVPTALSCRWLFAAAVLGLTVGAQLATPAPAVAQNVVEIAYATFLDPNNKADPRAAAQMRMIEAFEKANPGIKVRVVVDPTQGASLRALRSRADSPDVARFANWSTAEVVATGSVLQLDELIKRDKVSETDWLIPLAETKFSGKIYGMQQDYRIPVLLYRKGLLRKDGAVPPTTWDEVCATAGKLNHDGVTGYAVPLGSSGGVGGAQPLAENLFSSMVAENSRKYFADDGREFLGTRDDVVRTAQVIKDLYGKCKATPTTNAQFGYNETHDGLRAGTVAQATYGLFRFRAIQTGGAGDDLGWAPPPAFKANGKMVTYGFQVVVNANSPRREAAWTFTKFMTSPEGQAIAAEGGEDPWAYGELLHHRFDLQYDPGRRDGAHGPAQWFAGRRLHRDQDEIRRSTQESAVTTILKSRRRSSEWRRRFLGRFSWPCG